MKSQRSASKLHPLVDLSKRGPKQLIQIFMHFLQHTAAMLVLRLLKKRGTGYCAILCQTQDA